MTTLDNRHKRGFASMSPDKRREIASKGGKMVQHRGKGYRWTHETGQAAGRLGGKISRKKKEVQG